MNRPTLRFLAPLLLAAVSIAPTGCQLFPKKPDPAATAAPESPVTPADGSQPSAAPGTPGTPGAPADPAKPETPEAPAPPPAGTAEAAAVPTPEPAAPAGDPLDAEEFKGFSKKEAEFILACRAAGASAESTVIGRDGIVFSTAELRALGAGPGAAAPSRQAAVAGIAGYAATLKSAGVEFVLALVPPKAVVYPDYITPEKGIADRRFDSALERFYDELEKAGVRVVDLTRSMRSERFDRGKAGFPRAGVVWSPPAAAAAAKAIAKSVKRTDAVKGLNADKTIVAKKIGVPTDGETFAADSVGRLEDGRVVAAVAPKEGAPVLVVGDAQAAAYGRRGQSAAVGDQLSLAFGVPVETRSDPSLDWTGAASKFPPDKPGATKLVVWCLSGSAFLAAPPPVAPAKPAAKPASRGPAPTSRPRPSPRPSPGLKLRDDPGLDVRPQ